MSRIKWVSRDEENWIALQEIRWLSPSQHDGVTRLGHPVLIPGAKGPRMVEGVEVDPDAEMRSRIAMTICRRGAVGISEAFELRVPRDVPLDGEGGEEFALRVLDQWCELIDSEVPDVGYLGVMLPRGAGALVWAQGDVEAFTCNIDWIAAAWTRAARQAWRAGASHARSRQDLPYQTTRAAKAANWLQVSQSRKEDE